jgi:radical SAM superfamily enzyme YgiQ (UPF0313 family)
VGTAHQNTYTLVSLMDDARFSAGAARRPRPEGNARVLLSSVFGPYARDDEFGSRALNPMELYHNQVTRVQGPFSLRMFYRSWGLMFIQANIEAPCTLLDFPTLDRFTAEIRDVPYDVVGISAIPMNVLKVQKMCELVRAHRPQAQIVVGGHVANIPDLDRRIDADHIVRGEGVQWFRNWLGEDPHRPFRHPLIPTRIEARAMGLPMVEDRRDPMATVIPSVGCPLGCDFCATSAMFGGKGRFESFFHTGDELFDVMRQIEAALGAQSFFVMDENFLLDRRRALRLLELMQAHDRAWSLNVFSSANALSSYTIEQLVGLGLSWVWLGLEGENSRYAKLHGFDTFALVRQLQDHGVRVLGSTIIGLEEHTPANIDAAIERAVRHETDFHQFMLFMPSAGTPLRAAMASRGLLVSEQECSYADTHGQERFNYRHPRIPAGQEGELLLRAFRRDFERNGPSLLRAVRTLLAGWQRCKTHADARIRRRFHREMEQKAGPYAAAAAAAARHYQHDPAMAARLTALRDDLVREFGERAQSFAEKGSDYLYDALCAEEQRLAAGATYEPPTFYEANDAALALPHSGPAPQPARSVGPPAPIAARVPPPHFGRRRGKGAIDLNAAYLPPATET